jgi:hypothetical protein
MAMYKIIDAPQEFNEEEMILWNPTRTSGKMFVRYANCRLLAYTRDRYRFPAVECRSSGVRACGIIVFANFFLNVLTTQRYIRRERSREHGDTGGTFLAVIAVYPFDGDNTLERKQL